MKLLNAIIRPGEVLEILENGKIKVSAPGLFAEEDKDMNPPIMPFWELIGSHANTYSEPIIGDEVWVLNVLDNPLQLYWFRKDHHIDNNTEIFNECGSGPQNVEIICNRESGLGYASLFFSDGTGWILRNDDSRLQIYPDGHIEMGLNWPKRIIKIDSDSINIGGDDDAHPACYGDKVSDILTEMCDIIATAGFAGNMSPYTKPMATVLKRIETVKAKILDIKSNHVKIN